ncbi:uncharacterized protein LOC142972504 [Anticarsia gemmatalis]|uniref:uncharacterized protein LOC142972504 n=1 Tax=Anticarsia gemmatalis TaxID=129554 RepID=UPI003F75C09E
MLLPKCTLLFGVILTLLLDPILAKRGFGGGHSYPKSGGLSGGGHRGGGLSGGHGYPSSGGHAYPSSGGHAHPSSGNHGYPSGGRLSGAPSSGGNHGYPSSGGTHGYPSSGNNHGYPSSGGGLSGNGGGHASNRPVVHHTTHVHNNYHYTPPAQISYAPRPGAAAVSYPVYRGTPPNYVYQYKDSGSKYGTLLAGLALLNLGTLGVAAYAAHQATSNHGSGSGSGARYTPQPGEVCKFAIKKENGDYEETRIDCQIISSFILQDMQTPSTGTNSTVTTTTTVTNVTMVNTTNVAADQTTTTAPAPVLGNVLYAMLPNGTLVPVNATVPGVPSAVVNATQNATAPNDPVSSSVTVTTTTTNTTLVSALDVKGKPVEVTPGMQCFVMRKTPVSVMKKAVPCGLLQTYAEKSIQRNSAAHNVPMFTIVAAILAYCVAY